MAIDGSEHALPPEEVFAEPKPRVVQYERAIPRRYTNHRRMAERGVRIPEPVRDPLDVMSYDVSTDSSIALRQGVGPMGQVVLGWSSRWLVSWSRTSVMYLSAC